MSQGSLFVLKIWSAMKLLRPVKTWSAIGLLRPVGTWSAIGLLRPVKSLVTSRAARPAKGEWVKYETKNNTMKVFLFSRWPFYWFVCNIISCIKTWCLAAVFSLAKWTFCQPQLNVLHTEIGVRMVVLVWMRTESSCLSDRKRSWGLTRKSSARW